MEREKLINQLIQVKPSEKQLRQEEMEFYGFIHFTINTFTGKEWGDGTENPAFFCPTELNTDQWAEIAQAAGMKGLILTCKHHDGFCLWPSKYTEHSVKNSPYRQGRGDVVGEFVASCHKYGLKAGIYLSPWDRNCKKYGYGQEYDDFFVNQLTELLTGYGEIFTVWFDGACGEGENGKKQRYDWQRYYEVIRKLQPQATISICGPDIRWCGNEAGRTRKSEWSVVAARMADNEKIAGDSQQEDNSAFRQKKFKSSEEDLGSIERLKEETDFIWYPAEVDVSIRPGWFYHSEEDSQVKSTEKLFEIYKKSVGGNAMLLLNIPPNREGRIAEIDEQNLRELGRQIKESFAHNLLELGQIIAGTEQTGYEVENLRQDGYDKWYQPQLLGAEPVKIEICWEAKQNIRYIVLKENIPDSQRVEGFTIKAVSGQKEWLYQGTTIGYKKIVELPADFHSDKLTILLEEYRVCPQISFLGVY